VPIYGCQPMGVYDQGQVAGCPSQILMGESDGHRRRWEVDDPQGFRRTHVPRPLQVCGAPSLW
jgi:hypothetical protein